MSIFDDGYALVRRHPISGFAVVYGHVSGVYTPAATESHPTYFTLQSAVDVAKASGEPLGYSVHPECWRRYNPLVKGL